MEQASRSLTVLVVVSTLLVAAWLLVPRPAPVDRSQTPVAPIGAIEQAREISAASDATNAELQAKSAAAEAGTP